MISRLVARPFHGPHLLAALLVAFTVAACGDLGEESPLAPDGAPEQVSQPAPLTMQDFGPAIAAADRYTAALMRNPNIVGTGVGLNEDGKPSVRLFLVSEHVRGLPDHLDDVPVSTAVTGQFHVRQADPTSRARPAPMGFSVGHPDITAGTLGARVTDGTSVFILSNNHVLANSNDATIGDSALQPGAFDGGSEPDDVIGTLYDFEEISFSEDNVMDAAIALVDAADVSGSTPDGVSYGFPSTTVDSASVGMDVQKYGRTTGHTHGTVAETNVTVSVCFAGFIFCTQSATFVSQFTVTPGDFSDGGDSGSLIVTEDGNHPVGLLFAGSDTRTIANPIDAVLKRFGVTIDSTVPGDDGGDPGDPDPVGPTASFTYDCQELNCSFDASGSTAGDADITSYDWEFGDDNTGSGSTVSHTYGTDDTYTVTLTVTDGGGLSDSTSENVTVAEDSDPEPGEITIDQFDVNTRSTGPWNRADVTWTVSHSGGGLASVTTELLSGDNVLDSQTSSVSGDSASGEHNLRTRSDGADTVKITVIDVDGGTLVEEKSVFF